MTASIILINYTSIQSKVQKTSPVPGRCQNIRRHNRLTMCEMWVQSLGWEDPLEEGMATHSSILAWRLHMDRGAWWATVHGVVSSWTWLFDYAQTQSDQAGLVTLFLAAQHGIGGAPNRAGIVSRKTIKANPIAGRCLEIIRQEIGPRQMI